VVTRRVTLKTGSARVVELRPRSSKSRPEVESMAALEGFFKQTNTICEDAFFIEDGIQNCQTIFWTSR
jgi:hypothetical protein